MTNTYVLYHKNCPDGFGSAYSAWKALGSDPEYIPVDHGQDPPDMKLDSIVYVLDFCYRKDIIEKLADSHKLVKVLDHHITRKRELEGFKNVEFDMERSGAMMSWNHFHPNKEAPLLVKCLQDYDLWKFTNVYTKPILAYLGTVDYDFEAWDQIALCLEEDPEYIVEIGLHILEAEDKIINNILKHSYLIEEDGMKVAITNATSHWSEVGDRLLDRYPEAVYSKTYYDLPNRARKYSLRAKGKIDVSKIAELYGGGGHKNAAGYVVALQ